MKPNKLAKWIVGIGGVSAFTIFLNAVQEPDQGTLPDENSIAPVTESITNTFETNPKQNDLMSLTITEKEQREEWIASLDWSEGDWDVSVEGQGIVATPVGQTNGLPKAEQRTRRS